MRSISHCIGSPDFAVFPMASNATLGKALLTEVTILILRLRWHQEKRESGAVHHIGKILLNTWLSHAIDKVGKALSASRHFR